MDEGKNKRKELKNEKGFAMLSIIVFMATLVLPSVIWLFLGISGRREKLDQDLGENRNKASFPETFSTSFTQKVETYYNDRLPFRSMIISANRKLMTLVEKPYDHIVKSSDYLPVKLHNDAVIEGREGWLFFALENSLEDYLGSNVLSESRMESYLSEMEKLEDICREQGKQLFFLIPPNKEQVYSEYMPEYVIDDSYKKAQRLVDYVQDNSDICISYPLREMRDIKDQWQLYFKTDTHWTDTGAFVGVQALYAMMGMPETGLRELSLAEQEFSAGDLIGMGNLSGEDYAGDIRYNVYYRLNIEVDTKSGDNATADLFQTASSSGNPCNFVMVGDSFRISMGQYLAKDFTDMTLVNRECLEMPQAVEAVKDADVLVIELVERHSMNLPETVMAVCEILEQ